MSNRNNHSTSKPAAKPTSENEVNAQRRAEEPRLASSGEPGDASADSVQPDDAALTPGEQPNGSVVTDSGKNVGTWPDNGQPQKAGEPGELSPETSSENVPAPPAPRAVNTQNPQKAGEPGTLEAAAASGPRSAGAGAGGRVNPHDAKISKLQSKVVAAQVDLDAAIAERDADVKSRESNNRNASEVYQEHVQRTLATRAQRLAGANPLAFSNPNASGSPLDHQLKQRRPTDRSHGTK